MRSTVYFGKKKKKHWACVEQWPWAGTTASSSSLPLVTALARFSGCGRGPEFAMVAGPPLLAASLVAGSPRGLAGAAGIVSVGRLGSFPEQQLME